MTSCAPHAEARTAPIHERDIAAVAVRALTGDGHHGAKYALTGPEAIIHADQLDLIGAATGRELRFEQIPAAEARDQMTRYAPAGIWTRASTSSRQRSTTHRC